MALEKSNPAQAVNREKPAGAAGAAIALLVVFLACFTVLVGFFVYKSYIDTRDRVVERAEAAAQLVATNTGWMTEVAEQTLRRVDLILGDRLTAAVPPDSNDITAAIQGLPSGGEVYIADAAGRTIFSPSRSMDKVSVADRDYFIAIRDGQLFYTSALLFSRLDDQPIFVFSRRIERDGVFAGAAMITFRSAMLMDLWTSLDLGEGSVVGLVRSDGQLMARYPLADRAIDLKDNMLFTDYLPKAESGTFFSPQSPLDGMPRTIGYRLVPGTDIVAVAGLGTSAWAMFWVQMAAFMLLLLPVLIGLAIASFIIVRLLRRDGERQAQLEDAVSTNTMLFREIHHRVKNNLQSVQSLVRMQNIPQDAKLDLQSRFAAMAAMHEHIYRHDEYLDIVATDYVPAIVNPILRTFATDAEVDFDVDPVLIDRDHATPLALLLSELVTNSLKYAFPDGRAGKISVSLKHAEGDRAMLVVADNGVGMEEPLKGKTMGARLISGIVGQLNGTYQYVSDHGTRFEANLALKRDSRLDRS